MKNVLISPSILTADFASLGSAVKLMESAGADYIHCDVMDGVFVPNITFGIKMVNDLAKQTTLPMDVHLMIVNPEKYVKQFAEAGAKIITVHAEAVVDFRKALELIRACGARAGLSVSPDTPIESIYDVLDVADLILIMSVYPGFGGQSFIPSTLDKIRELRAELDRRGLSCDIEVDGGINLKNASDVTKAGANILVSGNAIFSAASPAIALKLLRGL